MKKLFCVILSLLLCANLVTLSFAMDTNQEHVSIEDLDAIETVLKAIAHEKEYYGFDGVDLSKLQLGTKIPLYEVKANKIYPIETTTFYPILDEFGKIVVISAVAAVFGEGPKAYISSELIPTISKYPDNSQIALIFDKIGVHCWDGNSTVLLEENSIPSGRTELSEVQLSEYNSVVIKPISPQCNINIDDVPLPIGYGDEAAFVNAPVKRQPSKSNWCWAACMASIVQHETGTWYSCSQMANIYTTDKEEGAYIEDVQDRLSSFGLDYTMCSDGYLTDILNTLGHGHLVYSRFVDYRVSHAMIIRGIDFGSKTFSVMDPNASGDSYASGQISFSQGNYGTLTYVPLSYGFPLTMMAYLYM